MADPKVTQDPVEIINRDSGSTKVTQDPTELVLRESGSLLATQIPVDVVQRAERPPINMTHMVVEIVGKRLLSGRGIFVQTFVIT